MYENVFDIKMNMIRRMIHYLSHKASATCGTQQGLIRTRLGAYRYISTFTKIYYTEIPSHCMVFVQRSQAVNMKCVALRQENIQAKFLFFVQ